MVKTREEMNLVSLSMWVQFLNICLHESLQKYCWIIINICHTGHGSSYVMHIFAYKLHIKILNMSAHTVFWVPPLYQYSSGTESHATQQVSQRLATANYLYHHYYAWFCIWFYLLFCIHNIPAYFSPEYFLVLWSAYPKDVIFVSSRHKSSRAPSSHYCLSYNNRSEHAPFWQPS